MSGYVKEWYASSFFINGFISANCTFGNTPHMTEWSEMH